MNDKAGVIWEPIIGGEDILLYRKTVNDIICAIKTDLHTKQLEYPGVLSGNAGVCILNAYANELEENFYSEDLTIAIEKSLNSITELEDINFSFENGVTGIAWVIQHLAVVGKIEADFDEMFSDIIDDLKNYSIECFSNNAYDYFRYGLGFSLLILEKENITEADIAYLNRILDLLLSNSTKFANDSLAWDTLINYSNMEPGVLNYDLGIAHGNPSIVLVLSIMYEKFKSLRNKIAPLLSSVINWMLSTKNDIATSLFPFSVNSKNIKQGYAPLRWCYGDMGVAIAIFLSGKRLDNAKWQAEGIAIMANCAERLIRELPNVTDAHICHGAAGIAHIFNRFYQYTKIDKFKDAAKICIKDIPRHINENNDGTIYFLNDTVQFGKQPSASLLEGSAGIALVLIAAISDVEPKWDRCLLLS